MRERGGNSACKHPLYWYNCYSGSYDLIRGESMAHPAKMSPALCYRILQHLQELGLLSANDVVLDPMAGTGITNICAGAMGYKSVSVELEEKFVNFQRQNKEYAERRLYKSLDWEMMQGDSRRLSELLGRSGELKSVTSPPYEGDSSTHNRDRQQDIERMISKGMKINPNSADAKVIEFDYGTTEGQIGNLKDTPLKSITSPPYQDSQGHPSLGSVSKDHWGREGKDIVKRRGLTGEYGESEGQVGNLKSITSPPYANRVDDHVDQAGHEGFTDKLGEYGESEGQIGKLKDKPLKAITSPPYGETQEGGGLAKTPPETFRGVLKGFTQSQGEDEDNIGNLKDTPLKAITSPPYSDVEKRDRSVEPHFEKEKDYPRGDHNIGAGYQGSPDNIGTLDDKPLKSVMSPPYEDSHIGDNQRYLSGQKSEEENKSIARGNENPRRYGYGDNEGQIGKEKSESYLEAMSRVYGEIAKVSDVLCVVVKNPTRNGELRRLDLDTIKLLEFSGWRIHCQHRALLFEELEQADMFEGSKKQVKGRLSFFKRLSYVKGQPVASWEDILVAVRKE